MEDKNTMLQKLLSTKPEDLARTQEEAMIEYVCSKFDNIIALIKERSYSQVREMMFYSPAGDDHGSDNYCINFGEVFDERSSMFRPSCGEAADLNDILKYLEDRKAVQKSAEEREAKRRGS